ncbi:hypothetical protein FJT64_021069 [Amphibalanus amphitrite]|uniref:Uncharacterized protein n=1 Tax=Amphibalanus amphitrite TaxID=1232801 RepID=A0A6A4WJR0_AMPAM|nr:hypothetical protein FJT64_021069 [Amphibalanus amphitrite]
MHLDTSGELIAWRPEAQEDQNENAVLRCAPIASLNDTWDLPQPSHIRLNFMEALAFDWVNENWHLTASRVSYVCSYLFDRCVKLAEAGGTSRFYAAYDMPNRLLFRIVNEKYGPYKLQVLNLDGTGLRELPVNITYPCGMAVDPVQKQIYILASRRNIGLDAEIYQVNYAGENERMIAALDERIATNFRRAIDDLVELGCHKKYPAYAVVASADSLQAVDLQTEQVTEILSGLNNVTDLAFFRAGERGVPAVLVGRQWRVPWFVVAGRSRLESFYRSASG